MDVNNEFNRNNTEQELMHSDNLLQQLFNGVPMGFALCEIILDKKGKPVDYRFLKINTAFENQSGLTVKTAIGKTIKEIYPDTKQSLIEKYGTVALTSTTLTFIEYNHHTNRYYNVKVFSPAVNKFAMLFECIAENIMSGKKTINAFNKLSNIEEIAKMGTWRWDPTMNKVEWSENMYHIFELDSAEFTPTFDAALKLTHPDDVDSLTQYIERLLQEKKTQPPYQYRIVTPNNKTLWVEGTNRIIFDDKGEISEIIGTIQDISERRKTQLALWDSEASILNKLKALTEPEGDLSMLELSDIIDTEVLQGLMEDFYELTGMLGAVLDVSGKVLVSVGWQDICTKFHRCHPDTLKNCMESDTILTNGVPEGTFKAYHCKNNMWDMVTPLMIGERHVGNIFIGQYFLKDEIPDYEMFRKQAKKYGFDEKEYLSALDRVPRFTKEAVNAGMQFYSKLTRIISTLSYSGIQQSRMLTERKIAEQKISESKERYELAMAATKDGLYDWNLITQEVYYSPGWKRMLGYTDEELPNDLNIWEKLAEKKDVERSWKMQQELMHKQLNHFEMEFKMKHKNGHWVDILSRAEAVFNEQGKAIRIVGTHVDITDRKKAEKEIIESEIKFKTLFESSPDLVAITDLDGTFLDINRVASGYTKENIIGTKVTDFLNPIHTIEYKNAVNKVVNTGITASYFPMIISPDGKNTYWHNRVSLLKNGDKEPKLVINFTDITDWKKIEKASKENEEKFMSIFEQSPIAIEIYDKEGKLINVNQKTLDMFGIEDKKYVLGFNLWKDPNLSTEKILSLKNGKSIFLSTDFDFDIVKKHQLYPTSRSGIMYMDMYGIPMMQKNEVIGYLLQIVETTKQKEYLKKLQERNEYIEAIMDKMPIGFALNTIDDGEVKYLNTSFEKIYGWSRDIITNTSIFFEKIFPDPDYREKMTTQIKADMQSGDAKRMIWKDLKISTSTGEERYVLAYNIPLIDQNLMISTVQDTTLRKLAEEEITKHREHLEDLVKERTKDLEEKNEELERFNDLFVNREIRIKELKNEIEKLKR